MARRISGAELEVRDDLADWRYVRTQLEASFAADSFDAATRFAGDVAAAAEAAGHHPDLDVRYPGRVRVVLTTHAEGGVVTEADLQLAVTVSELAAALGLHRQPTAAQVCEVAIDALDIDAVRPFWTAVLGYVDDVPPGHVGQVTAIRDPGRVGPYVWFQQMDEPRPQRNRIHLDVIVPDDVAVARVDAAMAAGGTLVSDAQAPSFWILADAEGNEACVCTWRDPG